MRATYDKSTNAAYIYLDDQIPHAGVSKTYPCDPTEVGGMINLDFNNSGYLIDIEVLDASNKLPINLLNKAEIIG